MHADADVEDMVIDDDNVNDDDIAMDNDDDIVNPVAAAVVNPQAAVAAIIDLQPAAIIERIIAAEPQPQRDGALQLDNVIAFIQTATVHERMQIAAVVMGMNLAVNEGAAAVEQRINQLRTDYANANQDIINLRAEMEQLFADRMPNKSCRTRGTNAL